MHNRTLSLQRRSLGRVYPADIESMIKSTSRSLDDMMASSVSLSMAADTDLSGQISDLNTRLVNEVVLPSDQLTDDEARNRLGGIANDMQGLKAIFDGNGIQIGQGSGQLNASVIPKNAAKILAEQMAKAFNIYSSIVDRYGEVRGYVNASAALPATGQRLTDMLASFDMQIRALDQNIADMYKFAGDLDSGIANASADAVPVNPTEVQRMEGWAAAVFGGDEALKRIEAIVLRKPVEATPSVRAPSNTPWPLIGIAGIALVGLAFWAIQD